MIHRYKGHHKLIIINRKIFHFIQKFNYYYYNYYYYNYYYYNY